MKIDKLYKLKAELIYQLNHIGVMWVEAEKQGKNTMTLWEAQKKKIDEVFNEKEI